MVPKPQSQKTFYILLSVLLSIVSLSLFSSFTRFVVAKDYNFHVEIPCEPTSEGTCFVRDCDDYCPPNGLESYKVFVIPALLYDKCTDNSCSNICLTNGSLCSEIQCSLENGDTCTVIE